MLYTTKLSPTEQSLQQSVNEALHESGRPELQFLNVEVEDDCAILTGPVPSYYARQLAQSIARQVDGVQTIRDEINVHGDWLARVPR